MCRHRKARLHHAGRLTDVGLVEAAVRLDIGVVEVVAAHLVFLLAERLAVGDGAPVGGGRVDDVLEVRDALLGHHDALHAVGQLDRDRVEVLAADLLEVGELGDLHPVQPHLPAEAPRADRRLLPVVLDEAHVVLAQVDPEGLLQRTQVQLLRVARLRLQDHLKLGKRLNTHRVLAIAGVVGAHRRLHVGHIPRLRAKHPQHRRRVHGTRTDLGIERLPREAPFRGPVIGETA